MNETIEDYIRGLNETQLRKELEFIVQKCFISGFGNKVQHLLSDIALYFRPPSEEFYKMLETQGHSPRRRTREQIKNDAESTFSLLNQTYNQLPFEQMNPEIPLYAPFFITREQLGEIGKLLPAVLADYRVEPSEYGKFKEIIGLIGYQINAVGLSLSLMKKKLKEKTGEEEYFVTGHKMDIQFSGPREI